MPARTASRAKPAKRFKPSERLFHLVSADDFVRGSAAAPRGRDDAKYGVEPEAQTNTLRAGAATICCRRPVADVYAVAVSKALVVEGPDVRWCAGAK